MIISVKLNTAIRIFLCRICVLDMVTSSSKTDVVSSLVIKVVPNLDEISAFGVTDKPG